MILFWLYPSSKWLITFDPTDDAYQYLAAGESTTLTINYSVTDSSGSVANNSFEILVTGTNTDPKVALDQFIFC